MIVIPFSTVTTQEKTFIDRFCENHGIPRDRFASVVFSKALYPHAHLPSLLIGLVWRGYFSSDYELIQRISRMKRLKDCMEEADHYSELPSNAHWIRRTLKIRISTRRLQTLFKQTLSS
jgi:hypothetical protein